MSQQRFSDMSESELDALIAGHIEHTAPGVATGAAHRCYERGKPEVYPKQMEQ